MTVRDKLVVGNLYRVKPMGMHFTLDLYRVTRFDPDSVCGFHIADSSSDPVSSEVLMAYNTEPYVAYGKHDRQEELDQWQIDLAIFLRSDGELYCTSMPNDVGWFHWLEPL